MKKTKGGLKTTTIKMNEMEIPLFWDHEKQCWRQRNFDLKRIPMKYRCPTCGKILVKAKNRKGYVTTCMTRDPATGEWYREERLPKQDEDLFERELELGFHGGVCRDCWKNGLGEYGQRGLIFNYFLTKPKGVG